MSSHHQPDILDNTSPAQIVIHYHYHYFIDEKTDSSQKQSKNTLIKRVRSDQKNKETNGLDKTDVESVSSKRSWKDVINPEYQAKNINTVRSFKGLSPGAKMLTTVKRPYTQRSKKSNPQDFPQVQIAPFDNIQRPISSVTTSNLNDSNTSKQHSFGKIPQLQLNNPNQDSYQNKFMKKREVQILNARELALQQSRLSQNSRGSMRSQQTKDYRYGLLEEQCQYLREKFLQHYVRHHPELKK